MIELIELCAAFERIVLKLSIAAWLTISSDRIAAIMQLPICLWGSIELSETIEPETGVNHSSAHDVLVCIG